MKNQRTTVDHELADFMVMFATKQRRKEIQAEKKETM